MRFNRALVAALVVGAGLLSGCQSNEAETVVPSSPAEDQGVSGEVTTPAVSDSSTFEGTGIVMNITPSNTYIVIEHQEISGFMGAMTMPFAIKDEQILKSVVVGDSIDFELTVAGSETYVSTISSTDP